MEMLRAFLFSAAVTILSIQFYGFHIYYSIVYGIIFGYIPFYLTPLHLKDGAKSSYFQYLKIWNIFAKYFNSKINVEFPLDSKQAYIFGCFPHGAMSINHLLTMSDSCGMLSKIHSGDRRDLCATALFYIPILREVHFIFLIFDFIFICIHICRYVSYLVASMHQVKLLIIT